MESELTKRLYRIDLQDRFWVVVNDGEDPVKTFLSHCPDYLEPEDFLGYCDQDWPEDADEEAMVAELAGRIEPEEVFWLSLIPEEVQALKLNPADWVEDWDEETDWCNDVFVPTEILLSVSKHGDMWGERWAE